MSITIKHLTSAFLLALFAAIPAFAEAGPVVRSGESVSVEADQIVEGDLYAAAWSVALSGEVSEDAHVTGGTVTVNAPVGTDFTAVGGTVNLHGDVADDVRIAGGDVTIAESVGGDVAVFAGSLRILSTAEITGDILFLGGEVTIEGPVGGSLFGFADKLRIDSTVEGDVDVTVEHGLTLGDRAEVLGNMTYASAYELTRAQNAVVVGDIQQMERTIEPQDPGMALVPFITLLFAALVLFLLMKPALQSLAVRTETAYGKFGLVGLAVFVVLPFAGFVLTLSFIGLYVGLLLIFLYLALLLAAWISAGIVLGSIIMKLTRKRMDVTIVSTVLGTIVLLGLLYVPLIGPLVVFAVFLIALGGIATRAYTLAVERDN